MNALKNIEAIVLVAIAVTFSATALVRAPAPTQAAPVLAQDAKMIQVVVSAKRLTPAEKAQMAG
jgi:hypothetical protein